MRRTKEGLVAGMTGIAATLGCLALVAVQVLAWAAGVLALWTALAFVVDLLNGGGIGKSFYAWQVFR